MTTPIKSDYTSLSYSSTPSTKVKTPPDEILKLFLENSSEFHKNSYHLYKLAKTITPEQAGTVIPLYLQFLFDNPMETLNERSFWAGLRKNSSIHDAYVTSVLASTRLQAPVQLEITLATACYYQIPMLTDRVLEHPQLTPSKELYEALFSNGSASQLNAALDRFGTKSLDPFLFDLMTFLPHDLKKFKEMMELLQNRGFDILEHPQKLLCAYPRVDLVTYWLTYFNSDEITRILNAETCHYMLYRCAISNTPRDFKELLEFLVEKSFSPKTLLLEKVGDSRKRSLIERLSIDECDKEALELAQSYLN